VVAQCHERLTDQRDPHERFGAGGDQPQPEDDQPESQDRGAQGLGALALAEEKQ
jgi:hypothetical protein